MEGIKYLELLGQWKGRGGFGLEKMQAMLPYLGNPQEDLRTFHIAGTNGKGSVSAALAAILGAAGHKVLLNTSPHLVALNERIIVDGLPIQDEVLNELLLEVKSAAETACIEPSHFEGITAAAFLACKAFGVDWGVFEVGLGGRLDATNVIAHPEACAIVTIDLDHEAILGDTLAKIAGEKAGILKPKSPVVIGKMTQAAQWVILEKARELEAQPFIFGRDFSISRGADGRQKFFSAQFGNVDFYPTLVGEHQAHNMAVAAQMALLTGISMEACRKGVESVFWPARLEVVQYQGAQLLIDSAHNPAGIQSLAAYLEAAKLCDLEIVFGAIGTKRWPEMIDLLKPHAAHWDLIEPEYSDPIPSAEIANYISKAGMSVHDYGRNYAQLLDKITKAKPSQPILVTGSMYMIGKLKAEMKLPAKQLWKRKSV